MSITGNWDRRRLSRRDFLAMSGMGATALALGTQGLLLPSRALAAPSYYPSNLGNPFTLGVASGHPDEKGVVLWTRLAPSPLNGGGMGRTGDVFVDWEVATVLLSDGRLDDIVLSSLQDARLGTKQKPAIAYASEAHSVHLEVGEDTASLEPGQPYYYRLMVRDSKGNLKYASPIGRTKTAGASVSTMTFAFASCQHLESGYYHAYRDMAARDLDLVIHLGDYLYEDWPSDGWARKYKTKQPTDLKTYRNRHAEYKSENPELMDAHRLHPWLCTWDDHEYKNNYAGDVDRDKRRDGAYQAYWEHMPLRKAFRKPKPWRDVTLRGHVAYGNLAQFCLLDTRQFRSDQPCSGSLPDTSCTERFSDTRRMLDRPAASSEAQLNWLLNDRLSSSTAAGYTWNVLANQTIMFELIHRYDEDKDGDDESYYVDAWDGYAHARNRLLEHLAKGQTPNPIVLTGDMHSSWASNLMYDGSNDGSNWKNSFKAGNSAATTVGAEFTGTSITSWLSYPADEDSDGWKAIYKNAFDSNDENLHVQYYDDRQGGYMLCRLDQNQWLTELWTVDTWEDVEKKGDVPLSKRATLTVNAGTPGLAPIS